MEIFSNQNLEIFLKLSLALVLGLVVGTERSIARKAAGMRTYGLVCMGSSLFIIISEIITSAYIGIATVDPLRVAAQIITAIGFLGAGVIFFRDSESKVEGITTAAGLWITAGIGMAVGFGLYAIAIFITVLTFIVFTILWFVEESIRRKIQ